MSIDTGNGIVYSANYERLISVTGKDTIEINANCQYINDNAFAGSKNQLKSFTFQSGPKLQEIGNASFYGCTQLQEINLEACTSLTTIKPYAFYGCTSVSSLTLPTSIKTLYQYSFSSLTNLCITLYIPQSCEKLGERVFYQTNIIGIVFEKNIKITTIPQYSFCLTKITSFTIPASVSSFLPSSFESTTTLLTINVEDGNEYFKIENKVLLSADGSQLYLVPGSFSDSDTIPSTITTIVSTSFTASQLKKIVIPSSTQNIQQYAFNNAPALESVTIPSSVSTIGRNAFARCKYLNEVIFEEPCHITELPFQTFAWCSVLQNISLPDSIKTIGGNCFLECKKLTYVKLPINITTLGGGVFASCGKNLNIEFGSGSQYRFDTENNFILSLNRTHLVQCLSSDETITIPSQIELISRNAFYNIRTVKEIKFDKNSNLRIIQQGAFQYCTQLKLINLPASVHTLGEACFEECTSLTSSFELPNIVEIPNNCFSGCLKIPSFTFSILQEIGESAFSKCKELNSFICGDCLESIGSQAFNLTTSLKQLILPLTLQTINQNAFYKSGVINITFYSPTHNQIILLTDSSTMTELNEKAFYYAENLQNINLPDTITKIGKYALSHTALASFTVPDSIQTIGEYCFEGCESLVEFVIPEASNLTEIGDHAFDQCTSLKQFNVTNNNFVLINQGLFTSNRSKLIKFPPASETQVFALPDEISMIGIGAFANCVNLRTIVIPENQKFTTISISAFENCTNLRTINIPDTVQNINENAFLGCKRIQCGQIISINEELKTTLVEVACFPVIGTQACSNTIQACNCIQYHKTLSLIFIGLISHK